VSVCFFGDGAAARGTFHEGIGFGALWKLPVIYVCENNQYQQWVPRSNVAVLDSVADMAGSYAIPGVSIDGQDIVEVYEVVGQAVERARSGGGPTLVEAKTYRFHGHSLGDEEQYRSSDEVDSWKTERDPITLFHTVMTHKGWLTEEEDAAIQDEAKTEITDAVKFAEESPYPTAANVTTDVLAPEQEVA
ncbi:MAG: thiamine pyrophosphate-dependent enzyme, partial [Candidatus Poribacteria bacterium]|nr:thiamine pyrophosphate-dependent enzyme [Candidatus Poribacteria bacterium]